MTISIPGDGPFATVAARQVAPTETFAEDRRHRGDDFARYNRAVGERCEAAVTTWFAELGLNPVRIDQRPHTKREICPPAGKRPDILADVDGDDFLVDVKNHRLRPCGRFALTRRELDQFQAFLRQPGMRAGVPLFLGFVPKETDPVLHLVDWTRLTEPCELRDEPALGIRLTAADVLGPVPQEYLDQAQADLIAGGAFTDADFLYPGF